MGKYVNFEKIWPGNASFCHLFDFYRFWVSVKVTVVCTWLIE